MNPLVLILPLALGGLALAASSKKTSGSYELDPNMPAAVQAQVLGALANETDPNKLAALAGQMQTSGYPLSALALMTRAAQLNVAPGGGGGGGSTPLPSLPNAGIPALDPGIDPQTMGAVLQALAAETDPTKLQQFAASLQATYPLAAALLGAKAAALSAVPAAAQAVAQQAQQVAQQAAQQGAQAAQNVPPPPGVQQVVFTAQQLTPGHSVHAIMTADQWNQLMVLLNDWLAVNYQDPNLSWIDLSWYRGNVDDLGDTGNMELAVDALQAWLNIQTGTTEPGGTAGTFDAYAAAGLFLWADKFPGAVHANADILAPFSVPLVAAIKAANGLSV